MFHILHTVTVTFKTPLVTLTCVFCFSLLTQRQEMRNPLQFLLMMGSDQPQPLLLLGSWSQCLKRMAPQQLVLFHNRLFHCNDYNLYCHSSESIAWFVLSQTGNSSQVSDGAGAVLLMRRSVATQKGLPVLGVFRLVITFDKSYKSGDDCDVHLQRSASI